MPVETLASFSALLKQHYRPEMVENLVFRESERLISLVEKHHVGAPVAITAAGIAAVATIAGLEWLRHRKAEVARAERTGDYQPLFKEFYEWLRRFFAVLRASVQRAAEQSE